MMKFKNILLILLCIPFVLTGCSQSSYEDIVCEEYTYFEDTYFQRNLIVIFCVLICLKSGIIRRMTKVIR